MDSLAKTLFTTIFVECTQIVFDLRWMILLGFMLIVSDLWFGIRASKYLNVNVRKSRAGRRTLNKIIDYICYISLGAVLGKAIGEPYGLDPIIVAISVMILCYCFELDSIYGHICTLHGIDKKYSIWKLLWLLITLDSETSGKPFPISEIKLKFTKKTKVYENLFSIRKPY